jgi:16S rRNA (uracil1498-N3)-methyltransferase
MHRFYVSQKIVGLSIIISDDGCVHHIKNVLRLQIGDKVTIFDGDGDEHICIITGLEKNQALMDKISTKKARPELYKITIACALPKKSKMDEIIDKLTQLGVYAIVPLITERVILKINENTDSRLERWRKIALNAAEQSQRNRLPQILPVTSFKDLLARSNQYNLKLLPTLEGERTSIRDVIPIPVSTSILVVIGPEGDFSPQEVRQSIDSGFIAISLGENVLKVDTAAIAVASYLKFVAFQTCS